MLSSDTPQQNKRWKYAQNYLLNFSDSLEKITVNVAQCAFMFVNNSLKWFRKKSRIAKWSSLALSRVSGENLSFVWKVFQWKCKSEKKKNIVCKKYFNCFNKFSPVKNLPIFGHQRARVHHFSFADVPILPQTDYSEAGLVPPCNYQAWNSWTEVNCLLQAWKSKSLVVFAQCLNSKLSFIKLGIQWL